MNRAQFQSGFTLIELMIVVAIIGILASMAITAYQNQTTRAQATESIVLLGGAGDAVDQYVSQTGNFPNSTAALTQLGIRVSGKYVSTISVNNPVGDLGTLTAQFKTTQVSNYLAGKTVDLTRKSNGEWTCSPGTGSPVEAKYLPLTCQ